MTAFDMYWVIYFMSLTTFVLIWLESKRAYRQAIIAKYRIVNCVMNDCDPSIRIIAKARLARIKYNRFRRWGIRAMLYWLFVAAALPVGTLIKTIGEK